MKISKRAEEFIKGHEALRLTAYRCPTGHWTIGWGHTDDAKYPVRNGMTITRLRAQQMFEHDVEEAEAALDRMLKVRLNGNQYGALVSLIFNIGIGAFAKSSVLRAVNAGKKNIARELGMWVKGTVKGRRKTLPGLVRRRSEEAALWATPASLKNVVVRPPAISGASEETLEARDAKLEVSEAKSKTPWKTMIGGGMAAAISPVLQVYDQLRSSFDSSPWVTTVLSVAAAVAIMYAIYSFMKEDDTEVEEIPLAPDEEVV